MPTRSGVAEEAEWPRNTPVFDSSCKSWLRRLPGGAAHWPLKVAVTSLAEVHGACHSLAGLLGALAKAVAVLFAQRYFGVSD